MIRSRRSASGCGIFRGTEMRGWIIAGLVLSAAGASLPRAANAQSPGGTGEALADEQARTHFESGRLHYTKGRFEQAADAFEAAYELSDRPQLLYNIYLAHRDAGALGPAAEALSSYLEQVPDAPRHEHLQARLEALRQRIEEKSSEGGGDPTEPTPDPEPDGDPGSAEPTSNAPAYALVGSGAALVAVGAVTGGLALKKQSDLEGRCTADRVCDPSLRGDRDRGRALAITTDVLVPVGAVAAGVGLVLWLTGDDSEERPAASAGCGPGGCAASVRLRF